MWNDWAIKVLGRLCGTYSLTCLVLSETCTTCSLFLRWNAPSWCVQTSKSSQAHTNWLLNRFRSLYEYPSRVNYIALGPARTVCECVTVGSLVLTVQRLTRIIVAIYGRQVPQSQHNQVWFSFFVDRISGLATVVCRPAQEENIRNTLIHSEMSIRLFS